MENMVNVVNGVNFVEETKEEKAMTMENQNVMAQEEVKMENVQVNEEVKQEEEMVKRFCTHCGKPMLVAKSSRTTICDDCREEKRKATAERAHQLAKERREILGVVNFNVQVYKETREELKALAKAHGMVIADLLKVMVEDMKAKEAEQVKTA